MIDLSFVRPAIELFYEGRAIVEEKQTVKDPKTKLTRPSVLVKVLEDEPCRLSNSSEPISSNQPLPTADHSIKLFIRPDVTIKPGSHIVVTQHGITTEYAAAGKAAVYCTHQEINLKEWDNSI